MHVVNRAVVSKLAAAVLVLFLQGSIAHSASFVFKKSQDGLVEPFKVKEMKLGDFIQAYSEFSHIPVDAPGPWEKEVTGKVTLHVGHPIKEEVLTELFHQALYINSYTVVDAPGKNGWIIERTRDAKDSSIPTYVSTDFPDTYRYITVVHSLKKLNGEEISRVMRNFMPPNSRIISPFRSQVILTAPGRYIKSTLRLVSELENMGVSKVFKEFPEDNSYKKPPSDQQQKIEKLVVEKLEINEVNSNSSFSPTNSIQNRPNPSSKTQGGNKK